MRIAFGTTSPSMINSEIRERPSSAPVATINSVLKTPNGASSSNHTARPGLCSQAAIGPAAQ